MALMDCDYTCWQHLSAHCFVAENISNLLTESIINSINKDNNEFIWEDFFKHWFRERGKPCYFLFRKNLGVTNTQYVELFSLIQSLSLISGTSEISDCFLFRTTNEIRNTLTDAINSLLDEEDSKREQLIRGFANSYADAFARTAAIDLFYCSCSVFLPPGVELDLEELCAQSGYVHSAGYSIYIRNIKKARYHDLVDSIGSYLESIETERKIPFVVYSHEDFDGFDKEASDQIRRGIDGAKLYIEKMSLGSSRLGDVVSKLKESFRDALIVPKPGSYKKEHRFDSCGSTFWLVGDKSISSNNILYPGSQRYYVCYHQIAKNASPLYYFDENKPAWKSHTTLPHTLTAALINSTRPHPSRMSICDPFGGTGTTWLEVKRILPEAEMLSMDSSELSPVLVQDNISFFLMSSSELADLLSGLKDLLEALVKSSKSKEGTSSITSPGFEQISVIDTSDGKLGVVVEYTKALGLIHRLRTLQPEEEQEFDINSTNILPDLINADFFCRLLFYVALRAEFRYHAAYKRGSMGKEEGFRKALEEMISQIAMLSDSRKKIDAADNSEPEEASYIRTDGKYSKDLVSSLFLSRREEVLRSFSEEVVVGDARDLKEDSLDIIICDPPYGFNTNEDVQMLADLYSEFIMSSISALRRGGHLIIVLPAESYTGRQLPYCTNVGLFTSQVLAKSRVIKRRLFVPVSGIPDPRLRAPYYWEAERALRRSILHFRIN
jgi:hypothetical protein